MPVEQPEQHGCRSGDGNLTFLLFVESHGATAQHAAGFALRQAEPAPNTLEFCSRQRAFDLSAQRQKNGLGGLDVRLIKTPKAQRAQRALSPQSLSQALLGLDPVAQPIGHGGHAVV